MKLLVRTLSIIATAGLILVLCSVPALAGTRPVITGLSTHSAPYWGQSLITVYGRNFKHVKKVMFGTKKGKHVHVVSSTKLTVQDPIHSYGRVHVWVVTSAGWSSKSSANQFTFTRPTMNSHIQGGLTGRQEQRISAHVRATHKGVRAAARSSRWTAAMGATAAARARSWLGLPYSWAGGNSRGPTLGVCAHNGGDMDCHIVGFDCSGLALYAWAPYKQLVHYAATQHSRAGTFHPTIGQLTPGDLVFFSGRNESVIGHVAVYEGNGNVIQAEQSGYGIMRSRLTDVIAFSGRYRGATRPLSHGHQAAGPHLSSVSSRVATKGGYLTITGSRLATATSVNVGGKMLYSFAKRTSSTLVVKVPKHKAGRVAVTVSNSWGSAHSAVTYTAGPQVSTLAPSRGPDTGGNTVTITGKNFTSVSKVTLGAKAVAFKAESSTRLTVTMPAHAAGPVQVTVYTRFGTSNQKTYTFVATTTPAPTDTGTTSSVVPPTTTSSSADGSSSSGSSSSSTSSSGSSSSSSSSSSSASSDSSSSSTSADSSSTGSSSTGSLSTTTAAPPP
jgi:cell wall-associated NlpC family hydrolase